LKLTRLIQLGLVTSTSLGLAGVLGSCTSGDDSLAAEPTAVTGAGNGSVAQAGSQTGPLGGGTSSVAQGGSGSTTVTAGTSSTSGGVTAQGGVSSSGGITSGGGTGTSAPCTNLPPNNGDTCAHAVQYGWCSQAWLGESCREACGKCSNGTAGTSSGGSAGSSSGGNASGGGGNNNGGFGGGGGQPPVIDGGTQGWATRYWDCCKPECGWKEKVPGGSTPVQSCNKADQSLGGNYTQASACDGDQNGAYMCGNFGPWAVSDTLAYGFAAVNMGSGYCGKCYQLQFSGTSHTAQNDPGSQSLKGKSMIVQAINTGGVDGTQFDLLIPGGGVGANNACSAQWSGVELGEQYGGFYLACQKAHNFDYASSKSCAAQKCQSAFANKPDFLAGCNFFVNWLGAPDNPNLVFKETTCPAAITQLSGLKR
jgi:Glycosyl hydrolase family 45